MSTYDISAFAPDLDSSTPGIIIDCAALFPRDSGYVPAPSAADLGHAALNAACRGAASLRKIDNTIRTFAGTQTDMFELSGTTWTDVSRAANYVGGPDTRWIFAQYGNVSLATNRTDPIQASTTGNFADLAGSPPLATFIDTLHGFVIVANTDAFGDEWRCSALNDHTSWATSVSTQAAKGRLLSTPGPIRASKVLGNQWALYKDLSTYLGTYVGGDIIWDMQLISKDIGCLSHESIVDIGTAHLFLARDDIYAFDGSRPQSIAGAIKRWYGARLNNEASEKSLSLHNKEDSLAYFFFPAGASTVPNECIVYNYKLGKWGRDNRSINAAFEHIPAGTTWDGLGALFSTWNDLPTTSSYDSGIFTSSAVLPAVFSSTDNKTKSLTGSPSASSATFWDLGDGEQVRTIKRVTPFWLGSTPGGSIEPLTRRRLSDAPTAQGPVQINDARFSFLSSAFWHRFQLELTAGQTFSLKKILVDERVSGGD